MSNEFDFDIGLKADYDGVVRSGEFEQNQYGTYQNRLTIDAEDGETPEIVCGLRDKAWVSMDGGETVFNQGSAKARLDARSDWAKFLSAAMECGAKDELFARSAAMNHEGPLHAGLLNGMRFHFDAVKVMKPRQNRETQEWKDEETAVVRPTKYLGISTASAQPTASTSTSAPSTVAYAPIQTITAPATTNGSGNGEIDPNDLRVLKIQAATSDTHEQFADVVMTLTKIDGTPMLKDKVIMTKLASSEWYQSLRG